jgi:predicted heme/steroid binding protein
MKKRLVIIPVLLIFSAFVFQGCGSAGGGTAAASSSSAGTEKTELVLTLEELSQYDGKNGNPAYIAVDGIIYDVTNVPQWKNGEHNGFSAGNDLTNEIKTISPHGVSKLKIVPVVGKLAE